ncbi:hypothetical protein D0C36_19175 [Mucilaginibacter conchicola]|uniref:Uncharacterized protein n=1 Tax=Mucilaginibacter conchicola TaxID=2303333 RepID=A0A372NQ55_9SPHI|nr:hypothetical protein [Mucilaginibacter conchicola]RFZ91066.1 hypothetical protein D0C36_19175 [Mucilaginibacter conchicola]
MSKNVTLFLTCSVISTFAFWGALAAKNPFPCFGIAFGIWVLFFVIASRRNKREAEKRYHERMFNEYMRAKERGSLRR